MAAFPLYLCVTNYVDYIVQTFVIIDCVKYISLVTCAPGIQSEVGVGFLSDIEKKNY